MALHQGLSSMRASVGKLLNMLYIQSTYTSKASASLEMKLAPITQLNACPEQVYLHLLLNVASFLQYINNSAHVTHPTLS